MTTEQRASQSAVRALIERWAAARVPGRRTRSPSPPNSRTWHSDGDFGAPRGAVARQRFAAVGAGDRVDDGEAEAGAVAGARRVDAAEALERMSKKRGREALSFVADAKDDPNVLAGGVEPDLPASVAEGVIDEVAERLLEPEPVYLHLAFRRLADLDRPACRRGAGREPAGDAVEQLAHCEAGRTQRWTAFLGRG